MRWLSEVSTAATEGMMHMSRRSRERFRGHEWTDQYLFRKLFDYRISDLSPCAWRGEIVYFLDRKNFYGAHMTGNVAHSDPMHMAYDSLDAYQISRFLCSTSDRRSHSL